MKKESIIFFGIIFLIFISGCSLMIPDDKPNNVPEVTEEVLQEENISETEPVGPGSCIDEECSKYCEKNQEECEKWCKENPELCNKMLGTDGHELTMEMGPQECQQNPKKCLEYCEKNPGICPEEHLQNLRNMQTDNMVGIMSMIGPGGCQGPQCQQYCQQKIKECQDWCLENPDKLFCKILSGELLIEDFTGGFQGQISEIVEPPETKINFAKNVNLIDGGFVERDIIKAKELGANIVTIWPRKVIINDEIVFSPEPISRMVGLAHKNGLNVELRSSFRGEPVKDYEKFRDSALKYVADFAKFAEKYKVYRIVPFGEMDNDLLNYCGKITELGKEMLVEMRKYYSGQIGIGVVGFWRDCGYDFRGYDYLTVSAYPQRNRGIDAWFLLKLNVNTDSEDAKNLAFAIAWARRVADRSKIPILHIGETGVINPDDIKGPDASSFAEGDKQKEVEYYQKFFDYAKDKVNGTAVFYNSLNNYFSVNGDPAEEVVNKWYNKLGSGIEKKETKLIIKNPIDLSQVVRISKFRSCAGHDYSGFNINSEKEPISSMKHYIVANKQLIGAKDTVKIFAPFDGRITEIMESDGKQVFISADKSPQWQFIFFHTTLIPDIKVGASVKAGQLIGQGYMREWDTFDIAFKKFSFKGEIFDSPFMHMSDEVLNEYSLHGITIENIILSKEFRDNHNCPIKKFIDHDGYSTAYFTGKTEKEDFVILK